MTRKNADFLRTIAFVSSTGSLSASTNVDCTVQMVTAQRGIPGPIDYPSTARQDDENVHAILNVRHDMTGGTVLSLNGGVRYSFQKYVDPDPFFPIASRYRNVQVTVNPEIQFVFASWYRLLAGAEYARGILDGNDFPALVRREQYAAFLSNEMIFEREAETFDRFAVVVAARYDAISDVNASAPLKDRVFFKAGLNGRVLKEYDVRVRASAGTNFRVPTFNDLYYVGFNNPTLKPERSSAVEAGLTATLISAVTHRIDVTLFAVDTRERILFDPVGLRPENIGRVESRGLEIHYDLTTRDGGLQLLADASFTEALKKNRSGPSDTEYGRQLPYVPAVTGSLGVTIAEGAFRFTAIQTHTSRRFTALAGGPSLPAFGRTDANAAWSTSVGDVHVRCRVEVSNLFDADYQLFLNYPLPGRSVQAGVEAEF